MIFRLPILVVQHICTGFTDGFVSWLQQAVSLTSRWPKTEKNSALAPFMWDRNRTIWAPVDFDIHLIDQPPVGGFRPSANELFQSVAQSFGDAAIALILTGMGEDGVKGLQSYAPVRWTHDCTRRRQQRRLRHAARRL